MIQILIVDDHNLVIEGIISLLQNSAEIVVCGQANSGVDCINFIQQNKVDLILMDINLPDMSGIELCKQIKSEFSEIKILALSTFNQISYINKMVANGANGYLLKNITKQELTLAINTVMEGKAYNSNEVDEIIKIAKTKGDSPILTKRESDILKLVVEGLTNPQIAEKLFISQDTVDSHRKNLHTKLGVNNTALLVRFAIENGLT
jgi:DNA-binding NarL/FixJ family response regulator